MSRRPPARRPASRPRAWLGGFSLVELMVSITVFSLLLLAVATLLNTTQDSWSRARARTVQFQTSREAFDRLTGALRQATLKTYLDYYYQASADASQPVNRPPPGNLLAPPTAYVRNAELQFYCDQTAQALASWATPAANLPSHALFFQAPLGYTLLDGDGDNALDYDGVDNLLNGCGYWIEFGTDADYLPPFMADEHQQWRFRLMEFRPPTEDNHIYLKFPLSPPGERWFDHSDASVFKTAGASSLQDFVRPIANNCIALIVSPLVAEGGLPSGVAPTVFAPNYRYDSIDPNNSTPAVDAITLDAAGGVDQGTQHILPPLVKVTLVTLDDISASRLADIHGASPPAEITDALDGRFLVAADFDADIGALETDLTAARLNYRIFSTTVAIRAAKWDGSSF